MTSVNQPHGIPADAPAAAREVPLAAIPWWGLVSAALAPVLFLAGYLYAASLTSSYALVTTTVSDLGAVETPTRWLMTFTLVFVGMAHVATALALRPVDVAGRWLLAAGGIAMIVLAFVPNNVVGKSYMRHTLASAIAFGLLAFWPAMSGRMGSGVPWPLRRRVAVVISLVSFVLIQVTLWGMILRASTDGIRELGLYAFTASWPLVVALWVHLRGGTALPLTPARRAA